jgi:hypothetical protein
MVHELEKQWAWHLELWLAQPAVRLLLERWWVKLLGVQMGELLVRYWGWQLGTELETLWAVLRVMPWAHLWEIQWAPPKEVQ